MTERCVTPSERLTSVDDLNSLPMDLCTKLCIVLNNRKTPSAKYVFFHRDEQEYKAGKRSRAVCTDEDGALATGTNKHRLKSDVYSEPKKFITLLNVTQFRRK